MGLHLLQLLLHLVVAILLLQVVFCLVEAVCIDKEQFAADIINLLSFIVKPRPQTDGRIGLHIDELAIKQGRIMAGIAEGQMTSCKVGLANEHSDEHAIVVILCQFLVQSGGYVVGLALLLGHSTEQADGLCHEE